MLKLKKSYQSKFPGSYALSLAADTDELAQAIVNDSAEHDNQWELVDRPEAAELEEFWTRVTDDLRQDPDWVSFTND